MKTYLDNIDIALLIEASASYRDNLLNKEKPAVAYEDPTNISFLEFASILEGKGYERPVINDKPYTNEQFVTAWLGSEDHPERADYAHILDADSKELLPASFGFKGDPAMKYSGTLREMGHSILANAPTWVTGSFSGAAKYLDSAAMVWGEVDWIEFGNQAFKGNFDGMNAVLDKGTRRFDRKYKRGDYDVKVGGQTVLPLGRPLQITEDLLAVRSAEIMKTHLENPKYKAYHQYMERVRAKDFLIGDDPMSMDEKLAYFSAAIAAPILSTGIGMATFAASRGNAKLAMNVASSLSFGLEGVDEWGASFEHYIELGYSPENASRMAHANALAYGAGAFYIEKLPMSAFLPKAAREKVKSNFWKSMTRKTGKFMDEKIAVWKPTKGAYELGKKINNSKVTNFITGATKMSGAESLEEAIQFTLQSAIQYGYKGNEAFEGYGKNVLESMRAGAVAGGGLGIAGKVFNKFGEAEPLEEITKEDKTPERDTVELPSLDEGSLTIAKFANIKEGLSGSDKDALNNINIKEIGPGKIIEILKEKGSTILDELNTDAETIVKRFEDIYPDSPEYAEEVSNILKSKPTVKKETKAKPKTKLEQYGDSVLDMLTEDEVDDTEVDVDVKLPEYESLNKAQLKSELKERGLPVSGNKSDLVQRLKDNDALDETALDETEEALPDLQATRQFDVELDEQGEPIQQELSLEQPVDEAPAKDLKIAGGIAAKVSKMPENTIKKITDLLLEEIAVGMAVPERSDEIRGLLSGLGETTEVELDTDTYSTDEIALNEELNKLFPDQKSRDKAISFINNTFITDKDRQAADAYSLGEIREVIKDMTSKQKEIDLMSKMSQKELSAYKADKKRAGLKSIDLRKKAPAEDVGLTDEDIDADFQRLTARKMPSVLQEPEQAQTIRDDVKQKYPEVKVVMEDILTDEEGMEVAGKALNAVAYWSKQGASIDTVPHEVLHVLLRGLRSDKTVQKAIAEMGSEEDFVQYAGEYYANRKISGKSKGFIAKMKTALRKVWTRIKKVLGRPAEYVAEQYFERGDMFAAVPESGDVQVYRDGQSSTINITADNTLTINEDQASLIAQMQEEGVPGAAGLLINETGKVDYKKADKLIKDYYKDKYDYIRYNNQQLPQKGVEFHNLKDGKFYSTLRGISLEYGRQRKARDMQLEIDDNKPRYQQLVPDTANGKKVLGMLDNALNAMMSRAGKINIGSYVNRLSGMIPDDMAIIFAHWKSTNPLVKKARLMNRSRRPLNNIFATGEEFDQAFDRVVEELDQGLDTLEINDKDILAKNSSNMEWAFLFALNKHITAQEMKVLLDAASKKNNDPTMSPQEAFEAWANEDLYDATGFKYKDFPGNQYGNSKRRKIKQLYIRATSSIRVNNGTLKNDATNLEFNTSTGELVIKNEVNEWTGETNHSREQNRIYHANNVEWAPDIVWLNSKDIYITMGEGNKSYTIKDGKPLEPGQIKLLAKKALGLEFIDDDVYGMTIIGIRGDSGNIMFTPIKSRHLDIVSDPAQLKAYWLDKVNKGLITKEQARNFLGFRLQKDGRWKKSKNAGQKKWLAAEIARIEAMLNLMPADMITNGAEFMRRSKIASTPVFTSPLMNAFKAVIIAKGNEKNDIVFVDNAGNEAPMVEAIPGMGSRNRTDGASIGGKSFFDNFWNAFGADPARKVSKNVIWDAAKKIAVKHETFMPQAGLKIMKKVEGKPSELIAEIDNDGNAFVFDGDKRVPVDMLMTDDEAKYSSYNSLEVFDVQGNEFGLIKYNSKKTNSKFPTQWFNYITDDALRDQIMSELMPRVKKGIQRLFTMTSSSEQSPQLIYKFIKSVQSDSPHSVTNTFVEKMKLGLGSHADASKMLNKLYKTQIMDRALQLADGSGTYLDIVPDYTGTHAENEVSISIDDADAVLQQYADTFGGTIAEAKEMGIRRLNQWLSEVPVGVLVSRSPIPYVGGVFVGRIKSLHDRGGQVVLNSDMVTKRLEGDYDGDAVQLEYLSPALLDSIDNHLKQAENDGRMKPINLSALTDKNMAVNDLSDIENMYSLMRSFILGGRAISQIANVQVVYGQLSMIASHFQVGDSFIQLKNMVNTVSDFAEAGMKNINMERQLRMWIQAAVDNSKHLLLDKWGYNRDALFKRLFAVTDGNGNYIRDINDSEFNALSDMIYRHLTPNSIRNGRNNKGSYTIETLLEESMNYKDYADNRHNNLPSESSEGLPIKYAFFDKKSPMEQIAIEFANMWEQNPEPGKLNPAMYTETVYNSVHVQSMRRMQDMKVKDMREVSEGMTESEVEASIIKGETYANNMWTSEGDKNGIGKGFVELLEDFEGEIGPKSWDYNPELLSFTDYWNAEYMQLTPLEQLAATYKFLEGFYQYNQDSKKVTQTKNRRVLPPVSINDKFTLLDGKVMAKYAANYNALINDVQARQNDPGTFTNYLQADNLIKKVCR